MKILSWNVNGIRAAWGHGLSDFIGASDADIYAFQETKLSKPLPYMELAGFYPFWSFCKRAKGYSGTLCLSRWRPIAVSYDFTPPSEVKQKTPLEELLEYSGTPKFDCEGRIITLEFHNLFFVNCYYPHSQGKKLRQDYRYEWDEKMEEYLFKLKKTKPTIVCGDFNATACDDDVYEENQWVQQHSSGFQSSERTHLHNLFEHGYVDAYRYLYPDERGKYSWWSNRLNKRGENKGWRIDYMLLTKNLTEVLTEATMLDTVKGSDHCPLKLELNLEMSDFCAPRKQTPRITDIQAVPLKAQQQLLSVVNNNDFSSLWENIDWDKAEKNLENMQMALAKSAYTKSLDLIEKWQNRIINSIDAKLLAVRHVCSNNGGPGIDGVVWVTPHEKMIAALSLSSEGYYANPARLLLVKSKNGKQRKIHIETYYDRAMQSLFAMALDPVAESWGERKSFAFRKGRSALDLNEYIRLAFSVYDHTGRESMSAGGINPPEWAFVGDVKQCYEHISHDWIIDNIPMDRRTLREFLKAGYVFGGELYPMQDGIGVGLSLSPIIANMTLDGMQVYIYDNLQPDTEEIDYPNGNLIRYADDIIVTARSYEDAERIGKIVRDFLRPRGLDISLEKSRIVNINEGFDFMSRTYIKRDGHVYIYPSESSVNRFMHTLRETVENHTGSQQALIVKLNKKLDGWATYHKTDDAIDAFHHVDTFLKAILLEHCMHKHPKWPKAKILEKYWYLNQDGKYIYALPDKKEVYVKSLCDVILVEHDRVKTNVNPYIDIDYLNFRTDNRAIHNATGIYRSIWNRQQGKCCYCGRSILKDQRKCLIEVDGSQSKIALRYAYAHMRCLDGSIQYIDTDTLPDSAIDVMELLDSVQKERLPVGQKFLRLSEFFRTCAKNSVTMNFSEIEDILGWKLGKSQNDTQYWYRTGFTNISQCWLDNGFEIYHLSMSKKRITFHQIRKETMSLDIPEVLTHRRIPTEAKYELENYFSYIVKKYGL